MLKILHIEIKWGEHRQEDSQIQYKLIAANFTRMGFWETITLMEYMAVKWFSNETELPLPGRKIRVKNRIKMMKIIKILEWNGRN